MKVVLALPDKETKCRGWNGNAYLNGTCFVKKPSQPPTLRILSGDVYFKIVTAMLRGSNQSTLDLSPVPLSLCKLMISVDDRVSIANVGKALGHAWR